MMKILNYGSLNYDYVYTVPHIAAEGETISAEGMECHLGGKGLNQSVAIARAGSRVYQGGAAGSDGDRFLSSAPLTASVQNLLREWKAPAAALLYRWILPVKTVLYCTAVQINGRAGST